MNALERAAILAESDVMHGDKIVVSSAARVAGGGGAIMAEIKQDVIRRTLEEVTGNCRLEAERLGRHRWWWSARSHG